MDMVEAQKSEFSAMDELFDSYSKLRLVAVVDDEYPLIRGRYETSLRRFLEAAKANQRIEFKLSGNDGDNAIRQAFYMTQLAERIHADNVKVGWWDDSYEIDDALQPHFRERVPDKYVIPTKLCLAHSEISEGMEGVRKNLDDDHLPKYKMVMVEIGDAIIRLLDLADYICKKLKLNYTIGEVVIDKLEYNRNRLDHKREVRASREGKSI